MKTCVAIWVLCCATLAMGETWREVLQKNHVPTASFSAEELNTAVSSGIAAIENGAILLAFPSLKGTEELTAPLHVAVYDVANLQVRHSALRAQELGENCNGAAFYISRDGDYLLVVTDITPSATCTLVLDERLRLKRRLFGWPVTRLGTKALLMQENEIHFAPVHAMRLAVYDFAKSTIEEVYPPKDDSTRQAFSEEIAKHMPTQEWCGKANTPCDPSMFDEDIVSDVPRISGDGLFFFVVRYENPYKQEPDAVLPVEVSYFYRRRSDAWTYCSSQTNMAGSIIETRSHPMGRIDKSECKDFRPVVALRRTQ